MSSGIKEEGFGGAVPVILGPTGSGKTGVGVEVARELDGEVISADSRAIYRYMDIGTAKPGVEDGAVVGREKVDLVRGGLKTGDGSDWQSEDGSANRQNGGMSANWQRNSGSANWQRGDESANGENSVVHWGVDLVEPGERFTVADWKGYAEGKIREIFARGRQPVVVGGTGLYIDALVFNYQFRGKTGEKSLYSSEQEKYTAEGADMSRKKGRDVDMVKKVIQNPAVDRAEMNKNFKLYGIKCEMTELKERLYMRANKLFNDKLYAETEWLVQRYGWGSQAMTSNIYQFAWEYMQGRCTREEAVMKNVYDDYHLARRQMTWFRRNGEILWLPLSEVKERILRDFNKRAGSE